ncbi:hypothetical protein L1987_80076 [Smallanthus sonchifolius]|uniref:Uncharacterized protein n=1 Tax=Smallanthus sonchifolius TaxID=185202 RepID=A0ACB8YMV0_9ASTR|nr:hypothetical protein L1987_80076 [Smallanthus sonchifolius]
MSVSTTNSNDACFLSEGGVEIEATHLERVLPWFLLDFYGTLYVPVKAPGRSQGILTAHRFGAFDNYVM